MKTFNLRSAKLRSGEEYRDEIDLELTPLEYGGERYLPVPDTVPAELVIGRASTGTVSINGVANTSGRVLVHLDARNGLFQEACQRQGKDDIADVIRAADENARQRRMHKPGF